MNDEYDELVERFHEAEGYERLAIMEQLIRLADANNEVELAYQIRRDYSSAACAEGYPEKGIVAFSWCLSQYDKDPELEHPYSLIWSYKVMLELIPIFDTVSRDQISQMQEDMAKRLAAYGDSERTAHYYRSWNLMRMGDYDEALRFQERYTAMPRAEQSDCNACERDRQIELLARMHRDEEAVKFAKPVISGQMTCGEVPHFTNGHIVKSLVRLGNEKQATERASRGYKLVSRERKYLGTIGDLLLVVVRNRNYASGMRWFNKHLPWVVDCAAGELKFRFLSAATLLLEALAADKKKLKIRIPQQLACHRDDDSYNMAELASWFDSETRQYADRFNKRNGNDRYDQLIADNRAIAGI